MLNNHDRPSAEKKEGVNSQGGTYLAVNFLGWACATSPFEAMAKLTLTYEGKDPSIASKRFVEATEQIKLWYIPNAEDFKEIENHGPTKGDGEGMATGTICGLLIYGGEANAKWVGYTLADAMERRPELIKAATA
tara:strand:+ start:910 stop:1314 length:405 start_codon:yes stop_codon:yes gene_type:complete